MPATDGPSMVLAALTPLERGWYVIPVHTARGGRCSCGEESCAHPAKHPFGLLVPHGAKDATNDPEVVRQWWREEPDANVGIATEPSGLVVLDIDPRNGGRPSLEALEQLLGTPLTTAHAKTGGGGDHFYFSWTGSRIKSRPLPGYSGIDVKAAAGYVVAPGSFHVSGDRYAWDGPVEPQPLPDALTAILLAEPVRESVLVASSAGDDVIAEGHRNAFLTSRAGSLRRDGYSQAAICAALRVLNREDCRPPLAVQEVDRIAASVARYPPAVEERSNRAPRLLGELELANRPMTPDLLKGMTPAQGLAALVGATETYKSFLLVGLGLSVAAGVPFCGADVVTPGRTVLVAAEGERQLGVRIAAWKLAHSVPAERELGMAVCTEAIQLGDRRSVDALIEQCIDIAPRLVMFDTLARCSLGLDENSAQDMGLIVAALDHISRSLSCLAMVAHHVTKQGSTERGSGALRGALDAMWRLERPDSERPMAILSCEKLKDGVHFDPVRLALNPIGESAALSLATQNAGTPLRTSDGRALAVLANQFGAIGATAGEWQKAVQWVSQRTFYRIRETLIHSGRVRCVNGRYFAG